MTASLLVPPPPPPTTATRTANLTPGSGWPWKVHEEWAVEMVVLWYPARWRADGLGWGRNEMKCCREGEQRHCESGAARLLPYPSTSLRHICREAEHIYANSEHAHMLDCARLCQLLPTLCDRECTTFSLDSCIHVEI
jgi:hypothetical protein